MHEQDSRQTQPLQTQDYELILERRKQAITNLINETANLLPPMAQTMLAMSRGTVTQYVNALTFEQTEELIDKVQGIVDQLRG